MNAIFRFFCLFLLTAVVEAQVKLPLPLSSLPIGANFHKNLQEVSMGIASVAGSQGRSEVPVYVTVSYTPTPDKGLEEWVTAELERLVVKPWPGLENADYLLLIHGDGISYQGVENTFRLERTGTGWKLPEQAFRFEIDYAGAAFTLPVTGYEVKQGAMVFSTLTGQNDFQGSCDMRAAKESIDEGYVLLVGELSAPTANERELTLWQDDKFVIFDRDGNALRWSETPPSFFRPEVRPLSLAIQKIGGNLEVCITGDGAEDAYVEESADLTSWGPAYSLSTPPSISSDRSERRQTVSGTGEIRFYRARAREPVLQNKN